MTIPSITEAKALALKHRKRGVLILTVGNGQYSLTTYGMTRADCNALRITSEDMARCIDDLLIDLPGEPSLSESAHMADAYAEALAALEGLTQSIVCLASTTPHPALVRAREVLAKAKGE